MAAKTGGYHYQWADGLWKDTKGQGEFFSELSRNASMQSGSVVTLQA
jgi:CyaY protein